MKKLLIGLVVIFSLSALASPPPPPPPSNSSQAESIYDLLKDVPAESYQAEDNLEINNKTVGCFSCEKRTWPGLDGLYTCGVQMNDKCDSEALYNALKLKPTSGVKSIGGLTCSKVKNIFDCQYFK